MLSRMTRAVAHRDWLIADEPFQDDHLCAARVDTRWLQPAPQPFTDGESYVWIDGELYHDEVDGAVLARGYRERGDFSFLAEVDGFFSAVLYEPAAGRVHLIADRHGFRQLFWTVRDGQLWWGTELKAAFELPGALPRPDPDTVSFYIENGFLPGDDSWVRGIELVPAGSVVTYDLAAATARTRAYWSWDDLPRVEVPRDHRSLVREWARLFVDAVARRCHDGRVGVLLSGGLDSRAILGAVPAHVDPLHAVTFGRSDSPDVRIAARAARVRGADHHVQPLSGDNWIAPRFEGVWWADGQTNIVDIHGIGGYDERRAWFDINLSGFLGDVTMGGSYLRKGIDEIEGIRTRGRRFIAMGLKMQTSYFENRIPFFDNRLLEYTMNIPSRLRAEKHIYADMLLDRFPELFRGIPWQETGLPVSWPLPVARTFGRIRSRLAGLRIGAGARDYGDYNAWLRRAPARDIVDAILMAQDALYPGLVSRETVAGDWRRLQDGADIAPRIGRYLTLEIWLQQAYNGRLRDAPPEMPTT